MTQFKVLISLTLLMVLSSCGLLKAEPGDEKIVGSLRISPDQEIYVMNIDGTNKQRLTDDLAHDIFPKMSPDGTKIAFQSDRDGNEDIYLIDADGGNLTNFTNHPSYDSFPDWSPDGKWIAFASNRDGDFEIYLQEVAGERRLVQVTDNEYKDMQPSWSPDGKQLVYIHSPNNRNDTMAIVSLDDFVVREALIDIDHVLQPDWSPGSDWIVFVSGYGKNEDISLVNVHTWEVVQITNTGEEALITLYFNPYWSSDGSKIIFEAFSEEDSGIYFINADGSGLTKITQRSFYYPPE